MPPNGENDFSSPAVSSALIPVVLTEVGLMPLSPLKSHTLDISAGLLLPAYSVPTLYKRARRVGAHQAHVMHIVARAKKA